MKSQRSYIDYSLDKRATLLALFRGTVDACDADPYLVRAAKWHGEKTRRDCPVCKKNALVELRYTFGEQLGQYSGRIKTPRELVEMEREFGEFTVYIVEVCKNFFRDVRDIASDFFGTKLGVACIYFVFLNVN